MTIDGSGRRRGATTYVLSARLNARVAIMRDAFQAHKVFEAGAIARLNHDAPAFRRLDGRRERGFSAATAFSVRMIMDDVSLMRSQSPMHGPCQRRKVFIQQ